MAVAVAKRRGPWARTAGPKTKEVARFPTRRRRELGLGLAGYAGLSHEIIGKSKRIACVIA
eukprot:scaffold28175_cov122-Isochrysis_galbana.AAC.2